MLGVRSFGQDGAWREMNGATYSQSIHRIRTYQLESSVLMAEPLRFLFGQEPNIHREQRLNFEELATGEIGSLLCQVWVVWIGRGG